MKILAGVASATLLGVTSLSPLAFGVDATRWEHPTSDEEKVAEDSAKELINQISNDYVKKGFRAFRDAHPRGIGCVAATFTVDPALPPQYQTGVFATPGKSYDALIRYSSSLGPKGDQNKDARGMAVKLFGVPGTKLLDDQPNATTVDFLQIDHRTFPTRDTKDFAGIVSIKTNPANALTFFAPGKDFIRHLAEFKGVLETSQGNPNNGKSLAETQYFSMVPYLLKGDQIETPVKFTSRPCAPVPHLPLDGTDGELRNDLQKRLNTGELCFEFAVQFYQEGKGFDIESGMSDWPDAVAPFTKFATIRIPQQTFLTDDRLHYCDNLSYQPWHTIAEHQPLGNLNRGRRIIYKAIAKARHAFNQEDARYVEPTDLGEWKSLTSPTYKVWDAVKVPGPG